MSALAVWEMAVRIAAAALTALAVVGSARAALGGANVEAGEASGLARRLRARTVYLIGAVPYFASCALLWRDLGVPLGTAGRVLLLLAGSVLGAAGAALYLGGRRDLGAMYNVSSALGSELYADQRLVTGGLYRHLRHPMYVGLLLASAGALLVFRTWTFVFVLVSFPLIVVKARREERLLAERFGPAWDAYGTQVPGWVPRRTAPKEVNDVDAFTT